MSRFIHGGHRPAPEVKKPAPRPKPGSYTQVDLEKAKPIISPNGGKR